MLNLYDDLIGSMEPQERTHEMMMVLYEYIFKTGQYSTLNQFLESKKETMPLEVYGFLSAELFNLYHSYMEDQELDDEDESTN